MRKSSQDLNAVPEHDSRVSIRVNEESKGEQDLVKYNLKSGDYVVQAHIIEVRALKGLGVGTMSDPIVKVECFGKVKHTKILKQTLNGRFDEVLHFIGENISAKQVESEKLRIRVMDANTFKRDQEIGSFDFDLSSVYFSSNHEIFNQWVALTHSSGQSIDVQGYLKVSLVCLGPDDEQVIHSGGNEADLDDEIDVLLPPKIEQIGHLLTFNFYAANDLIRTDFGLRGSSSDPYFIIQFAGTKIRTSVQKGLDVTFNEAIELAVMEPIMSNNVIISLYDRDIGKKDDLLGRFILKYDMIKSGVFSTPRWFNLYGASEPNEFSSNSNDFANRMNEMTAEGSTYRGKVFLSAMVTKVHVPRSNSGISIDPFPFETLQKSVYVLQADLYQAIELSSNQDWQVSISIGKKDFSSSSKTSVKGSLKFYEIFKDSNGSSNIELELPSDTSQCPDIVVYLCSKKKRVSYFRFDFESQFKLGFSNPPKWITMKEDKSLDLLKKQEFPGLVLIGLRVGLLNELPPAVHTAARPLRTALPVSERLLTNSACAQDDELKVSPSANIDNDVSFSTCSFKVSIMSATNLPAMDSFSHSSDPYVKFFVGQKSEKTRVMKKELNPVWNEDFFFENVSLDSKVVIKVKDHDVVGKSKVIGEFTSSLRNLYSANPVTKWVRISQKYVQAKLQFRLEFEPLQKSIKDESVSDAKSPINSIAKSVDDKNFREPSEFQCLIRVFVYSARKLRSEDLSGFSDPFVLCRCNGVEVKTKTQRNTLNPVYYESLDLLVSIPESEYLIPDLQVLVYDEDIGGLLKSCIGRTSISFQEIIKRNGSGKDPNPEWFKLFDNDLNTMQSSILLAFEVYLSSSEDAPAAPKLISNSKPEVLEVFVLGLRNLTNFWGIHKPFLEFELNGKRHIKTSASCIPSANNPNLLYYWHTPVNIPENSKLAPIMGISMKDSYAGGLFSRTLGATIAELGNYRKRVKSSSVDFSVIAEEKNNIDQILDSDSTLSSSMVFQKTLNQTNERISISSVDKDVAGDRNDEKYTAYDNERNEALEMVTLNNSNLRESNDTRVEIDVPYDDIDSVSELLLKSESKWSSVILGEKSELLGEEDKPFYMKGRTVFDNELEDEIDASPFDVIPIVSGNRECGIFKGIIRVSDKPSMKADFNFEQLIKPNNVFVRLYVLQAENLTPTDSGGSCDPYLIVKIGNDEVNTRSKYLRNTCNPKFYDSFEFPCQIPGVAQLQIEVWDYDGIGDDFIGGTAIDIEDRWFSEQWRDLKPKPLERRTLKNLTSRASQGKIELWVEILTPQEAKVSPLLDLKPPNPLEYELRVIVWETRDVVIKDTITDQNDLYVTASIDGLVQSRKKTDTHLRAKKGKASFNWRMKFPVRVSPTSNEVLRVQLWDMDFFSANDSICEAMIPLRALFRKALKTSGWVKLLDKDGNEKIWFEKMYHSNFGEKSQGSVQVSIELLPLTIASQYRAGNGRDEPNQYPYLPKPEGRLEFDILRPWKFIEDILGENMCRKICLIIFLVFLGVAFYFFTPTLFSLIIADIVT